MELPLATELHNLVVQVLPPLRRSAQRRLVWFVLGILLAESIVVRRMAVAQAKRGGGSSSEASHERRLRRFLNDPRMTWAQTYAPALRRLLRWKPAQPVYLLVDESGHTDQVRLLLAALWYQGRAIPLAWVQRTFALPDEVSYWDLTGRLLEQVAEVLPRDLPVIVIADRAFGTPAFTQQVEQHGWNWVVRVQGQTCFRDCQGRRWRLRDTVPHPGSRWKGQGEVFRKKGWQPASVVAFWDTHHQEPLIVVSNLSRRWELIRLYLKRGAIEGLFRDWKSGGWHWESSQVRDFTHREHQYLGMAWATLLCLGVGREVARGILHGDSVRQGKRVRWTRSSLFTLGRNQIQHWLVHPALPPAWVLPLEEDQTWEEQVAQRQRHARIFA